MKKKSRNLVSMSKIIDGPPRTDQEYGVNYFQNSRSSTSNDDDNADYDDNSNSIPETISTSDDRDTSASWSSSSIPPAVHSKNETSLSYYPQFVPSLFPHRPSTVSFHTLSSQQPQNPRLTKTPPHTTLHYKCYWERNCIKKAFTRAGFQSRSKNDHKSSSSSSWSVAWIKPPSPETYTKLSPSQKINHFPNSWCLGRKDRLHTTLSRATPRSHRPRCPETWILPRDRATLLRTSSSSSSSSLFIVKPCAGSSGRGVSVTRGTAGLLVKDPRRKCVVQRYVSRPYLIKKKKFDLRLYVLVTSFDPLRVYLFKEGLVRFSAKEYDVSNSNLNCRYVHLTNYAINKKCRDFVQPGEEEEGEGSSCKWSLAALWRYLEKVEGVETVKECREEIKDIIVRTLIAAEEEVTPEVNRNVKKSGQCFELFGFDILLDRRLKAWLLEVNVSPSLMGPSPLDKSVKGTLFPDLLHLVGLLPYRKDDDVTTSRKSSSAAKTCRDEWRRRPLDPETVKLEELTPTEWETIYDLEDEYTRRGNFLRIFPVPDPNYLKYFRTPRFNNALVCAWLQFGRPSYRKRHRALLRREDEENSPKKNLKMTTIDNRRKAKFKLSARDVAIEPGVNCAVAVRKLEPLDDDRWEDFLECDYN